MMLFLAGPFFKEGANYEKGFHYDIHRKKSAKVCTFRGV